MARTISKVRVPVIKKPPPESVGDFLELAEENNRKAITQDADGSEWVPENRFNIGKNVIFTGGNVPAELSVPTQTDDGWDFSVTMNPIQEIKTNTETTEVSQDMPENTVVENFELEDDAEEVASDLSSYLEDANRATPVVSSPVPVQEPKRELTQEEIEELRRKEAIRIMAILNPNVPGETLINQLKSKYGDENVFAIPMSAKEVYVFRAQTRGEYEKLVMNLANLERQAEMSGKVVNSQFIMIEQTLLQCVLFPKLTKDSLNSLKAGTLDTLFAVIRAASNFMPINTALENVLQI